MKGADSHGSCKNYYKNFVIAGAYMPDNHTAGGYVHHMAVCNGISYPVGNHLYHSCIGVWIRTGNRHRGIQNACNRLFEKYLLNNTKFERGSTGKHGFATLYMENGKRYINLNLQMFWSFQ